MSERLHTMVSCERCNGKGERYVQISCISPPYSEKQKCDVCNGTGVRVCID